MEKFFVVHRNKMGGLSLSTILAEDEEELHKVSHHLCDWIYYYNQDLNLALEWFKKISYSNVL